MRRGVLKILDGFALGISARSGEISRTELPLQFQRFCEWSVAEFAKALKLWVFSAVCLESEQ